MRAVKQSPQYRAVRPLVAQPYPSDVWLEAEQVVITFNAQVDGVAGDCAPQAVFVLNLDRTVVSCQIVTCEPTDAASGAKQNMAVMAL